MKNRVRIGTCAGPADAALVRSVFAAHDIPVLIGAEHHAGMLGGLGGSFVSLDIIVDETDAEDAVGLLRDIREGDHADLDDAADGPDLGPDDPDRDADADADADGVWVSHRERRDDDSHDSPSADSIVQVTDRRRRTAIALLLSVMPGLGAAHMFTGAWLRGLVLAGVQILRISYIDTSVATFDTSVATFFALTCAARLGDAVGAVWRIWSTPSAAPPPAR